MLILTFELQYPFRGDLGISPTVWTGLRDTSRTWTQHGTPAMRM